MMPKREVRLGNVKLKVSGYDPGAVCHACRGTGAEFPGHPRTEKCEECDGTGRVKAKTVKEGR
jgi:DnaJ-class molecular chaperone